MTNTNLINSNKYIFLAFHFFFEVMFKSIRQYSLRKTTLFLWEIGNKISLSLFAGILLITYSCEFLPGKIPETNVQKPSEIPPDIEVELSPEIDTLRLFDSVIIKYRFNAPPRKVHWVQFYFDGELIFQKEHDLGNLLEMNLNIDKYNEGLYKLEIKVFVSSNSGSIADKVKAEGYLYQLNWPVLIDRTSKRTINFVSVKAQPGGVMVKWEKFPFGSFNEYMLTKLSYFHHKTDEIVIADQNKTEYFDNDYIEGENISYGLSINGLLVDGLDFSQPPCSLIFTAFQDYSAKISWEPTQNPEKLDYYRLFTDNGISPDNLVKIPYSQGTSFFINRMPFGRDVQYNIQFIPKTSNTNFSFGSLNVATTIAAFGDLIPSFEVTKRVQGTNRTLYTIGNKIVLFNHLLRTRIDSLDFGSKTLRAYRISPNGKVVYTLVENILEAWKIEGFMKLNEIDLMEIDESLTSFWEMSVSNDSKVLFSVNGKLILYDFANNKVVFKSDKKYGVGRISPEGRNIVSISTAAMGVIFKYFEIEQDKLNLIYDYGNLQNALGIHTYFSSSEINKIIVKIGDELQIRDVSNFQLIKSLDIPQIQFLLYDPETNRIIYQNNNNIFSGESYLIQLPSEEILDTFYLNSGNVVLHKNFLIGRNGRQLDINKF